ncbi:hypothetical protein JG687_00014192 [Phytophthora cactorum]|uniref:Uncharacterized protein n=1 Tax=Phytophthora cactorum TaxID=29920 RepID=A0A8T1TXI6_9STRA|nr:hypothetical protein JG687_00014192 [Phytophthora cactorum]
MCLELISVGALRVQRVVTAETCGILINPVIAATTKHNPEVSSVSPSPKTPVRDARTPWGSIVTGSARCTIHLMQVLQPVRGQLPTRMFPVYILPSPGTSTAAQLTTHRSSTTRRVYSGIRSSEMDHILENQCFSYAFHYIPFRDVGEDVDFLASLVREDVVNELPNLCFTRAATNTIKGAAVWKFLDDCLTGHVGYQGNATFNDYLLAENRDAVRLGRETTRVISGEMGIALKFCQQRLANEGETPEIDALSDQLQQLYVRMQLHTARSAVARARARTKSQPYNVIPVSVTTFGSRCLESVGGAVETSLRVGAAAFTPRAMLIGDPASQSSINARARSEDIKAVEPSRLSVGLPTDANTNNTLEDSVSGDHIVGSTHPWWTSTHSICHHHWWGHHVHRRVKCCGYL